MPPDITDLPFELLSEITRNVISKKDLRQLRRVNSLFETLTIPEIFNRIIVRNHKQSADGFWSLLQTSRLASHIQSILFVEDFTTPEKEIRERLEVAFSILHQAAGLKTLELRFTPYYHNSNYPARYGVYREYDTHQWNIVYALANNRNPLSALQSLKLDGWRCGEDKFMLLFDEAPIAWLAASLRHLSFTVPQSIGTSTIKEDELLERFWKPVVVRRMLQPAVNLESLVIAGTNGWEWRYFDESQAELPTFPRLAALSLRDIIWTDDTDGHVLEFIVRHQKTLEKLELRNCAINIRERFWQPRRYWADVYKRLTNALTGLVELKVEFKIEDRIPYVCSNHFFSRKYLNKDDLKERQMDADLAQDALALEEFRAAVESRRRMGGRVSTVTPDLTVI